MPADSLSNPQGEGILTFSTGFGDIIIPSSMLEETRNRRKDSGYHHQPG
jgi:hypothetical protein